MYITVWGVGSGAGPARQLAASFTAKDAAALKGMDGYRWTTIEQTITGDDRDAEAWIDSLAAEQNYRIATRILARPPVVVRASFHDYMCDGHAESRAYFTP